tara:strand:- start:3929 stop:4498 length:570 start_codon:yes stop_codon:yes gene_type:complete
MPVALVTFAMLSPNPLLFILTKITIFFLFLWVMEVRRIKRKRKYKVHDRQEPEHNFMKYWRLVRTWANSNYDLSQQDIELLFFLYSENLFTRKDFKEFCYTLSWDRKRFTRFVKEGWIIEWRKSTAHQTALFELSFKAKRLVNSVYRKLLGEEPISDDRRRNNMFTTKATQSHMRSRALVAKFNKDQKG